MFFGQGEARKPLSSIEISSLFSATISPGSVMFHESGKNSTTSTIAAVRMLHHQFARAAARFDIVRIVLISR